MRYQGVSRAFWYPAPVLGFSADVFPVRERARGVSRPAVGTMTGRTPAAVLPPHEQHLTGLTLRRQSPGPGLTTATWRCRENFSQWKCSFLWKLRYHLLKGSRQHQIAVVRQGPGAYFNVKGLFPRYRNSHYKDKTVSWPKRPVLSL